MLRMAEKTAEGKKVSWRHPLYVVIGALVFITCPLQISVILYTFGVVPIISGLLLYNAIDEKRRELLLALLIYWAISVALIMNSFAVRTSARWMLGSQHYKAEVQAQPTQINGDLKHIEWDGWGMFSQDTVVYLVFDATDSLFAAASRHQAGKFSGIPCEVALVHRLESHWYTVQFYTTEDWGECE